MILMILSKAQRLLMGIAIGDAFGRYFENMSRLDVKESFIKERFSNPGVYTDDTQMALAVANLMISDNPFDPENLAEYFVQSYEQDKRVGYSPLTQKMLENSRSGQDFLNSLTHKEKSMRRSDGSAMRALPIGLFKDPQIVIENAKINSNISHGHPNAVKASVAIALVSHYFYYEKGNPSEIIKYILENTKEIDSNSNNYIEEIDKLSKLDYSIILGEYVDYGPPYNEAIIVLGSVLFLIKHYINNPFEGFRQSILFGGDVDTTASIVLGVLLMNRPIDSIPSFLFENLENNAFGRDYILNIGKKLGEKFPPDVK